MLREADKGRSHTRKSYHGPAGVCIDSFDPGDLDRNVIVNRSFIHLNLFRAVKTIDLISLSKLGYFAAFWVYETWYGGNLLRDLT
jgi:hypothetical protein